MENNKLKIINSFLKIFLFLAFLLIPAIGFAVPLTLNYQGFLKNTDETPISDTIKIQFSIYESIEQDEAIWTESHNNIQVNNGFFKVILGQINSLSWSIFDGEPYLGVKVNDDPEMNPRTGFNSVVFAIKSGVAEGLIKGSLTTSMIADGAITTIKINDKAITSPKIEDGAVTGSKIADGAVSITKITHGPGSGLNADFLDDKDSSEFALKKDIPALDQSGNFNIEGGVLNLREMEPNESPTPTKDYGKIYVTSAGIDKNASDSLTNGLVMYLKMDDNLGLQIIDSVASANDADIIGTSFVDGQFGKAREFSSSEKDYIRKSHASNIDFDKGDFTITFWLKADQPNDWATIIQKADDWSDKSSIFGWVIGNADTDTGKRIEFSIQAGDRDDCYDKWVESTTEVFDNEWHYITAIKKGTEIFLYVDGKQEDKEVDVTQSVSSNSDLFIGSMINSEFDDYYFNGIIDEIAIYNRAISTDEISKLFNNKNGQEISFHKSNLCYMGSDGRLVEITKFWDQKGLNLLFSGEKMGIGTDNPQEKLDVNGNVKVKGNITATEKIGIGTASPQEKLDVNGNVKVNGNVIIPNSANGIKLSDGVILKNSQVLMPSGAVMAFDLDQCPAGWSEFKLAKGRTIIGTKGNENGLTNRNRGDFGGAETHQLTIDEMPNHSHTINLYDHYKYDSYNLVPGSSYNSKRGSTTTQSAGGNKSHNNMPPFVTLLYCKKN